MVLVRLRSNRGRVVFVHLGCVRAVNGGWCAVAAGRVFDRLGRVSEAGLRANRAMTLTALTLFAGSWAMILVVAGLVLAVTPPAGWAVRPSAVGGVSAIASGILVFSTLVAGRLFPMAARRVGPWLEITACATLFAGFAWLGFWLVFGGG